VCLPLRNSFVSLPLINLCVSLLCMDSFVCFPLINECLSLINSCVSLCGTRFSRNLHRHTGHTRQRGYVSLPRICSCVSLPLMNSCVSLARIDSCVSSLLMNSFVSFFGTKCSQSQHIDVCRVTLLQSL